jgi:predicted AlkP superfamily pyrophosphatase or phosphodiesterase
MSQTIPNAPKSLGKTRHVLNSCQLAVKGKTNPLGLSSVSSVIVVFVDGLGYRQLEQVSGHAPTIWKNSKPIKSGFPATTSVNIKSFASGLTPSEHGFLGYRLKHNQGVTNLLTDLDKIDISEFAGSDNISDSAAKNCRFSVVSRAEYENSGFSKVTLTNAEFYGIDELTERFLVAGGIAQNQGQVIYLYIPELDKTGHKEGWGSTTWIQYLEQVDSGIRYLAKKGLPVVLTSDHGMINTNPELQIHLDKFVDAEDIEAIAGDTRTTYLHTKLLKTHLQKVLEGQPLSIFDIKEVEDAGWFGGEVRAEFRYRLPEIVLVAKGDHVILHKDFNTERAYSMVGHHGTFDDREIEVPLMRIGL